MSYIRAAWPLKYVEGASTDYVFLCRMPDGSDEIQDYGSISDAGFVELLFHHWETEDVQFKEHLLMRLASRLDVKIRDKPLTNDQILYGMEEQIKKDWPDK